MAATGSSGYGEGTDLGGDGERRRRGGRRRLKDGKVTAGQNNSLSAGWHECACARHGERSELGRRGPVRAGGGGRGRRGPAEEGRSGVGGREGGRERQCDFAQGRLCCTDKRVSGLPPRARGVGSGRGCRAGSTTACLHWNRSVGGASHIGSGCGSTGAGAGAAISADRRADLACNKYVLLSRRSGGRRWLLGGHTLDGAD